MFSNKEVYQDNRNTYADEPQIIGAPHGRKRGQGEKLKPKHFKKGDKVYHTKPDGTKVEVVNNEGQHRSFTIGGKLQIHNRIQSRQKVVIRDFTRKGFKNHKDNTKSFTPSQPPSLTNNQRMHIRAYNRLQKKENESK